jgi:hypothetical protein
MPLPTFFIIGAAKAGTTSLHFYLDQHPEIGMSKVKEPNFFSGPANGNDYPLGRVPSLAEYEVLFDQRFTVRGEASVGYSNAPRRPGVPAAIKALVARPKMIYLVRDPVERTISQYRYRVAMEGERRDLDEALSEIESPYCVYACPSLYGSQLELYLREFDQADVLVLEQRDLRERRAEALAEIFAFLGVDPAVDQESFRRELNASDDKRAYSPRYVQLRERLKASPLRHLPRGPLHSVRSSAERILYRPVPNAEPDPALRRRLEERFAPEADRLRALTGKRFETWSV